MAISTRLKTDWALVQAAALVLKIKVLTSGFVMYPNLTYSNLTLSQVTFYKCNLLDYGLPPATLKLPPKPFINLKAILRFCPSSSSSASPTP